MSFCGYFVSGTFEDNNIEARATNLEFRIQRKNK